MAHILDEDKNPFIGELCRELRSIELQGDRHRFRQNLRMLGTLMGYEISRSLDATEETVTTPLGRRSLVRLESQPVLGLVLRASIPMWEGMLDVFRDADSLIVGAARVEGSAPGADLAVAVEMSYRARPEIANRDLILVDPMIATGSTMIDIVNGLKSEGQVPRRTIIAGAVGYRGALERLESALPGVEIWLGTCDDELDEKGYIVPGLGDAGDLCFGPKA